MADYQIQCKICGAHFPINNPNDKVPKHTPDGKIIMGNTRVSLCRGSGVIGRVIKER